MNELFNYQPLIDALLEKGINEDQIPNVIEQILNDITSSRSGEGWERMTETYDLSSSLLQGYVNYVARLS
jgi:hypothetical protein